MARRKLVVSHFLACPTVVVDRAGVDNPYTLVDVRYDYWVPADREWPARLDDLWLYTRFYNGRGVGEFELRVDWLDDPNANRPPSICLFPPLVVQFPSGTTVLSRAWRVSVIEFPGEGRYRFTLHSRRGQRLATDYIRIRRAS